uniref:Ribosomal_L9_C domain-containing protein n=1 Tax=Elaeophora elaphi TaxID=1147741 RepID=A0A0R3S4X1_9BILA
MIRYYARRNQTIRVQKQAQLFDELMERTREKYKIIHRLCEQRISADSSENTKSATRIAKLGIISEKPIKTTISNMEICEKIDEYGRNIARIQIPQSILYESAIEIKKFGEKDADDDDQEEEDE